LVFMSILVITLAIDVGLGTFIFGRWLIRLI